MGQQNNTYQSRLTFLHRVMAITIMLCSLMYCSCGTTERTDKHMDLKYPLDHTGSALSATSECREEFVTWPPPLAVHGTRREVELTAAGSFFGRRS